MTRPSPALRSIAIQVEPEETGIFPRMSTQPEAAQTELRQRQPRTNTRMVG